MPFTLTNLRDDPEDVGSNFDGPPELEFRAATKLLGLEQSGLTFQSVPPDYRFPYGHTHETQEEVYVVVGGSGRMAVDDEVVEIKPGTRYGSHPVPGAATRPARKASSSLSSAPPTSATTRATTSKAPATGGPSDVDGPKTADIEHFSARQHRWPPPGR